MTPEARRDRAAILRHGGVAPASDRVLAALRSVALFRAFAYSFCAYLSASAKLGVKSPVKRRGSALFRAGFTKVLG